MAHLCILPIDLKLLILQSLRPPWLIAFLSSSKTSWAASDQQLWRGLCVQRNIVLPHLLRVTEKTALLKGLRCQQDKRLLVLYELRSTIWGSDAAAKLSRVLSGDADLNPSTPLPTFGHSTLLQVAARRGRLRCVEELVKRGACIDAVDDGQFTALAGAAWSGHVPIVLFLVDKGANIDVAGVPPMTSACGGKGPYTAEEWALRKAGYYQQFDSPEVAAFLEIAEFLAWTRKMRNSNRVADSTQLWFDTAGRPRRIKRAKRQAR